MQFILAFILLRLICGVPDPPVTPKGSNFYSLSWEGFYRLPAARQPISLQNPDYPLLNAAVFHVSNKVRLEKGKPGLNFLINLQRSADFHSEAMIRLEFFDHYNLRQLLYLTPDKRIRAFGGFFHYTSENIAQYDLINTDSVYCPIRQSNGYFKYVNCQTQQAYRVYSYLAYAEAVVAGWLRSPPHRATLLNDRYEYLGCAVRISKDPNQQKRVPFACITQNFGGYQGGPGDSTKNTTPN